MDSFQLFDREPITGVRRDGAGNLIAPATVARTGIYDYAGFEVGRPDMRRVRVFRPASEVFSRDTMRSLAGVPVTINHPKELVTTENWADHAKGETSSDDIVRDGEAVRVPFIVRDATAIKEVEDGKHELSPGYTAVIDWTAGQTEQGEAYDAVARSIRYNHLAIVDKARGGSDCRIGDELPEDKTVKTILIDGFQVEVTDQAEIAVQKIIGQRDELTTKLADSETALAAEKVKVGTLEGEKAALETKLTDATNPATLSKAAAERSKLCDQAKALHPKIVTDDKSDDEIRKEVVVAKMGDAAAALDDNGITGAFAMLVATAPKGKDGKGKDALRDAITETGNDGDDTEQLLKDHATALADRDKHLREAHKPTADKE